MKTKRIVALALTAAMAVSMASMTAFAADQQWLAYTGHNADNSGDGLQIVGDADSDYKEFAQGYFVDYKTRKFDADTFNGQKTYLYRKGSTIEESTTNGKTVKKYILNTGDATQTGKEKAGLLWKNLKAASDQFGTPSMDEEDNCVFMGWTIDGTADVGGKVIKSTKKGNANSATWLPADTSADAAKILKDDDDVIALATTNDGTAGKDIEFYPVFREKTAAEKLQSAVNIANRPKVAKPAGSKDGWVYTQKDLDNSYAKVSAPFGEASSADALKKCNAEMKFSRVYEIKPAFKKDDGSLEVVDLKKGATEEVYIPVTTVYDDITKVKANEYISKGKLKVYHIGSDGKSRQVTGITAVDGNKAGDAGTFIKFKCGSFSEFVVTKDPNARAQAGEEDGASGGNPATGEASTLPVAMLALAALSATGIVAYKKRKAE